MAQQRCSYTHPCCVRNILKKQMDLEKVLKNSYIILTLKKSVIVQQ